MSDGEQFDDIEVVTMEASLGVEASNVDGSTAFVGGQAFNIEGETILDYDEVVDRNEELRLLSGMHHLTVWSNSTQTADGTIWCDMEVSTAPVQQVAAPPSTADPGGASAASVVGTLDSDDSIDVIGRSLRAVGTSPFSEGAGAGGGGSAGEDSVEVPPLPSESGIFHPRDDLFLNGQLRQWNIADAGIHVDFAGQHVYGVIRD